MQIFFLPIETNVKFCDFKIYFDLQIFLKYILNLFFSVYESWSLPIDGIDSDEQQSMLMLTDVDSVKQIVFQLK